MGKDNIPKTNNQSADSDSDNDHNTANELPQPPPLVYTSEGFKTDEEPEE